MKNACVYRWNTPAAYAPTPTPRNMNPSWDTVEYASTFLMSFCTSPMLAANRAVKHPTPATTISAVGLMENSPLLRATRYTPLVTMVAAWISALTGVGPAMASGSHTYSGICALFPVAPTNSRIALAVITHGGIVPPTAMAFTSAMSSVPNQYRISISPAAKPMSPIRFVRNAFFPASAQKSFV